MGLALFCTSAVLTVDSGVSLTSLCSRSSLGRSPLISLPTNRQQKFGQKPVGGPVALKTEEGGFRGNRDGYVVVRSQQLGKDERYVRTSSDATRGSFSRDRTFQAAGDLAEEGRM